MDSHRCVSRTHDNICVHRGLRTLFALTIICLMALAVIISLASALGTETLISVSTFDSNQRYPAVSGNWIVWEDNRAGSAIYLYNAVTGIEQRLTDASVAPHAPAIDGNRIVWYQDTLPTSDIYLYDIDTGATTRVTNTYSMKTAPAIDNDRIVWQNTIGVQSDIMMYDAGSKLFFNLTPDSWTTNQEQPAIYNTLVVWQDNRNGAYDIYMNDTSSATEIFVTPDSEGAAPHIIPHRAPSVYGTRVVWEDERFGDPDIWMYDTATATETQIATDPDAWNQIAPSLFGDRLIWLDDRFGQGSHYDVMLIDDVTKPVEERLTGDTASTMISPKIDRDRIVWFDNRNGKTDIFMNTIGSSVSCPVASFTASPIAGIQPLTVRFTDTTSPAPTHSSWDLGDSGTSISQDFTHLYNTPGLYPVTLTVNNDRCRNATPVTSARYIFVGVPPLADFEADTSVGMVPLTVKFTSTSTGLQTGWDWNFGDGTPHSTIANPSHTYSTKGSYTVSLTATNAAGSDTKQKVGYIHALSGGSMSQSAKIDGITIQLIGGQQQLNFDTTRLTDYIFNPADNSVLVVVPPAVSGFQQITFFSLDGIGFSQPAGDPFIQGKISRTNLMSRVLPLNDFNNQGELKTESTVNYTLDFAGYPTGGLVTVNVYDDTVPDGETLDTAVQRNSFSDILGTPYVIQCIRSNINGDYQASFTMSIDSTWVANHGTRNTMYVIRIGEDQYGEVLPVTFLRSDPAKNLDYFVVSSPHGLSKFAPSTLSGSGNVFQMVYLGVVQHFVDIQSSSDSSYGLVASTAKGSGQGLTSKQDQQAAPAPESKSVDLFINEQAVVTQTTILQSPDQLATLSIGQGVVAKDSAKNPLSSVTIASASMSASGIPESLQGSTFRFAGIAYNLQPDGATFSPAATITFTVPQAQWSQHYMVKEWDPLAQVWVDLPTTYHPESGTISASVSNFCIIALFSDTITPSPTPPRITVQTPLPTIAPPQPTSPFSIFYGMVAWLADMIMKNLYLFLIVAAIVVAFYINRRRKGRDPLRFK